MVLLIPDAIIQKNMKSPSLMGRLSVETPHSRLLKLITRPWQRKAGFQSQTADIFPFLQLFFHLESPFLSHPVISCPSFQAQPKHTLPWTHPGLISSCYFPKVLLTSLISHEGLSYSGPSCVYMHTVSLSSWRVRSVVDPDAVYLLSSQQATQEVLALFHRWGNWD